MHTQELKMERTNRSTPKGKVREVPLKIKKEGRKLTEKLRKKNSK
jgi:hypothetical protein